MVCDFKLLWHVFEIWHFEYILSFEYLICTLEIVCIILIMFSIAVTPQSTIAFFFSFYSMPLSKIDYYA